MHDPRIEAAAKAVCDSRHRHHGTKFDYWNFVDEYAQEQYRDDARAALDAADKAATITNVRDMEGLTPGSRVVLADTLLIRMAEVVDETVWRDLGNACPFDRDEIRMLFAHGWKARVIHWGSDV